MGYLVKSVKEISEKDSTCKAFYSHVKIIDIKKRAHSIKNTILNTSWINSLIPQVKNAYRTRAEETINRLVENILTKVDTVVASDFGEIMVSSTAVDTLCNNYSHKGIPLAELWKEKISGNPAFDFHTETTSFFISFGEAKFNSNNDSYRSAMKQVSDFIDKKKDIKEGSDLFHFVSDQAYNNFDTFKLKAYTMSFSLCEKEPQEVIIEKIKNNKYFEKLTKNAKELYFIGIEVCS